MTRKNSGYNDWNVETFQGEGGRSLTRAEALDANGNLIAVTDNNDGTFDIDHFSEDGLSETSTVSAADIREALQIAEMDSAFRNSASTMEQFKLTPAEAKAIVSRRQASSKTGYTRSELDDATVDDYQWNQQYNDWLDEIYGTVTIGSYEYSTSNALKEVDPTAYRTGFGDFIEGLYDSAEDDD